MNEFERRDDMDKSCETCTIWQDYGNIRICSRAQTCAPNGFADWVEREAIGDNITCTGGEVHVPDGNSRTLCGIRLMRFASWRKTQSEVTCVRCMSCKKA